MRKRASRSALYAAASFLLIACMGGTGTDTENGITAMVVDGNGRPVEGVTLSLHTTDYRPDSGGVNTQKLVAEAAHGMVSDFRGYVFFKVKQSGTFVVEAARGSATLVYDTLSVTTLAANVTLKLRLGEVETFRGRVHLASGMKLDSGFVFIRGTDRMARLDSAGSYSLGTLPLEIARMAIGLSYRAGPRELRVVELKKGDRIDSGKILANLSSSSSYQCREVSRDSLKSLSSSDTWKNADPALVPSAIAADTNNTNAALQSCDSLARGTLVNVRLPVSVVGTMASKDSVVVPFIVIKDTLSPDLDPLKTPATVAVPVARCLKTTAAANLTYSIGLRMGFDGWDILAADIAEKCVTP
jgi:hypothetical protein